MKKIILPFCILFLLSTAAFAQEMEVEGDLKVTGNIIFNDGTSQSTAGSSSIDGVIETRMYTLENAELRTVISNQADGVNPWGTKEFDILEITGHELDKAKVIVFGISNVISNVNHFDLLIKTPKYSTQSYYVNNFNGISHNPLEYLTYSVERGQETGYNANTGFLYFNHEDLKYYIGVYDSYTYNYEAEVTADIHFLITAEFPD